MPTKRKRVTIKLPHDVYQALAELRKESGVPISNIVRLAIYAATRRGLKGVVRRGRKLRGSR
jgi:predicted DNA-binding protein